MDITEEYRDITVGMLRKEMCECLTKGLRIAALDMALSLVDICAKNEGVRYDKWFDEWVYSGNRKDKLNGKLCYALRCAFLHSGNTKMNKKQKEENKGMSNIVLAFNHDELHLGHAQIAIYPAGTPKDKIEYTIRISVEDFVNQVYNGVGCYLETKKDGDIQLTISANFYKPSYKINE